MIGAGEMAQAVELLPFHKHRNLRSSRGPHANDSSVVTCVLNLRTGGEQRQEGSLASQFSQYSISKLSERPCLKKYGH